MNIPLSPCVPEHLVSRDVFSRPVPRQPAHLHTQAESVDNLRYCSRVPRRPTYETAIRHRVSPDFIGSRNCVPMASTAESPTARASKPQGSFERVLPWQIPMDQLIERHRYAIAWPDKLGTDPMAYGGLNKDMDAAAEFRSNPLT